ncbi:MAG: ABC transporter ATP-binding protein [Clostridia bacterium]|nr:ABC transporter ATP-binding protein [Clostridia bacterium]MBR5903485.1 ABC transporter ATP-binding protein [Clostridia bacterium]
MLRAENITVAYDGYTVLDKVSFELKKGSWLMVAGPNGAGKSTLAKALAQSIPYEGKVIVGAHDARDIKPALLAKKLGMLEQNNHVGYAFSVSEIVRLGRYSYRRTPFSDTTEGDEEQIQKALEYVGLTHLADRSIMTLSGGEVQRVFLAQLIAQDPEILILDEPTNHLDLIYQKQVLELVAGWVQKENRSVISVVHDLSLVKAFGTDVLLLSGGKTVAFGKAEDVLTDSNLNAAYGMQVRPWMQHLLGQWK